jgi:hypothetical protein
VLVAAAMKVLSMFVATSPAFAQEECSGASCELHPGFSERTPAPNQTPPLNELGNTRRASEANDHDQSDPFTGQGERILG